MGRFFVVTAIAFLPATCYYPVMSKLTDNADKSPQRFNATAKYTPIEDTIECLRRQFGEDFRVDFDGEAINIISKTRISGEYMTACLRPLGPVIEHKGHKCAQFIEMHPEFWDIDKAMRGEIDPYRNDAVFDGGFDTEDMGTNCRKIWHALTEGVDMAYSDKKLGKLQKFRVSGFKKQEPFIVIDAPEDLFTGSEIPKEAAIKAIRHVEITHAGKRFTFSRLSGTTCGLPNGEVVTKFTTTENRGAKHHHHDMTEGEFKQFYNGLCELPQDDYGEFARFFRALPEIYKDATREIL